MYNKETGTKLNRNAFKENLNSSQKERAIYFLHIYNFLNSLFCLELLKTLLFLNIIFSISLETMTTSIYMWWPIENSSHLLPLLVSLYSTVNIRVFTGAVIFYLARKRRTEPPRFLIETNSYLLEATTSIPKHNMISFQQNENAMPPDDFSIFRLERKPVCPLSRQPSTRNF